MYNLWLLSNRVQVKLNKFVFRMTIFHWNCTVYLVHMHGSIFKLHIPLSEISGFNEGFFSNDYLSNTCILAILNCFKPHTRHWSKILKPRLRYDNSTPEKAIYKTVSWSKKHELIIILSSLSSSKFYPVIFCAK